MNEEARRLLERIIAQPVEHYLRKSPMDAAGAVIGPAERARLVVEDGEVVGEADVKVASVDPNYRFPGNGMVCVRIVEGLAMAQAARREADRVHRQEIDPCGLGLYGPSGSDDAA